MIVTDPWATFSMGLLVVTFGLLLILKAREIQRLDRELRAYDHDPLLSMFPRLQSYLIREQEGPRNRSIIRGTGIVFMIMGLTMLCLAIYRWIEQA